MRHYDVVKSLLSNPKVTIVIDDGRRWLHRHKDKFDAIVQNTTHHWRAHITNLVSREYIELVNAHLEEGRLFYHNSTRSESVQKTMIEAYPYVRRYHSFIAGSKPSAVTRMRSLPLTFSQRRAMPPSALVTVGRPEAEPPAMPRCASSPRLRVPAW